MLMSDRHINASALEHSQQSQASVLQIYPLAIDSNHVSYPSFHFFSTTAFGSTTPLKKQRVFAVLTIHHGFLRRIFYPTPTILNASSESIPDEGEPSKHLCSTPTAHVRGVSPYGCTNYRLCSLLTVQMGPLVLSWPTLVSAPLAMRRSRVSSDPEFIT
jgi:hypothetical protein